MDLDQNNTIETDKNIHSIINEISNPEDLLRIVQYAEPLLTSIDSNKRAQGALLLQKLVSECDKSLITAQSATVFLEFFLSRLDDKSSVANLIEGIRALINRDLVSKTDQLQIPSRFFSELNVQSFDHQVRSSVFKIFALLFEKNLNGLKKLGKVIDI